MTRGVVVDLFQLTNRIGTQCEAAEYEDLAGEKVSLRAGLLWMVDGAIEPSGDDIVELSMKAPLSMSKPADLG